MCCNAAWSQIPGQNLTAFCMVKAAEKCDSTVCWKFLLFSMFSLKEWLSNSKGFCFDASYEVSYGGI